MAKVCYDLHIHSILSPCGHEEMTPNNIVNMSLIKGLGVIAVTDHNTCRNCRAVMEAGKKAGLTVIPGMELQTAEDVHVLCLFENIRDAERFSEYVFTRMMKIKNNQLIFGYQVIMNAFDNPCGEVDELLTVSTDIGIYGLKELVMGYKGICIPAHVDKESNGLYPILGGIDPLMGFRAVEVKGDRKAFLQKHPELSGYTVLKNSDAHYLGQISEPENCLEIDGAVTAKKILELIGG